MKKNSECAETYLIVCVIYAVLVGVIAIGLNLKEPVWWVQALLGLPVIVLAILAVIKVTRLSRGRAKCPKK